jgi:divalent metal cation (Fe/Co/Zn/Cd) transporter
LIYQKVFDLVEAEPGVKNPHRMRIRKVGNRLMINIDVEMNGDLSLRNAHELAHILEKKVRDGLKYEVFDVIIHTEPYGDEIKESELGVSREVLKKNEVD